MSDAVEPDSIDFGTLVGRTLLLLRRAFWRCALVLGLLAAGGTIVDAAGLDQSFADFLNFLVSVASLAAQYWLVKAALADSGCGAASGPRFWAFIGLNIVSTIAIVLGLVVVVPGIFLAIRWWVALPVLLATDAGIFESLAESWRKTEPMFWPLLAIVALIWVPAAGICAGALVVLNNGGEVLAGALVFNVTVNLALIFGWHLAVAAYSCAASRAGLSDVFA